MRPLLQDEVVLEASRERLWALLDNIGALKRILPGCEELEEEAPGRYRAVMHTKLQFLTLRVKGTAQLTNMRPPDHVQLEISGKPLGLAGSFNVIVPIDVFEAGQGRTRGVYRVEVQLTGRLASFGAPILRSTVKGQVRQMIANLEREMAAPMGADA